MTPPTPESALDSAAQILQAALQARMEKNPAYSLRAFARDVGVSHAFVSAVIRGKKPLSVDRASQIAEVLRFTRTETRRFVRAAVASSPARRGAYAYLRGVLATQEPSASSGGRKIEFQDLERDRLRAITTWWHFAVADLLTCDDARSDCRWIARRLGITTLAARDAVQRLLKLGILETRDGRWVKAQRLVLAASRRPDALMRQFHKLMLTKALETLSREGAEDMARRDLLSMTVAVNPARIERAHEIVAEFNRRIVECLTDGPCTEVYQFNCQILPLTRREVGAPV